MPTLEQIPLEPDWNPAPPEVEALFAEAEQSGRRFTDPGSGNRVPSLVNTSASAAWSILTALDEVVPPPDRRLCEWGCGLGAVACLASHLGWTASGIDNADGLIGAARGFAADQGLDVAFEVADYGTEAADPEHPALFEAEVIYAYAWPTEALWLPDRVACGGRPGQVLAMYEGGVTLRTWRLV